MTTVLNDITLDQIDATAKKLITLAGEHKLWCFYGEMGAGKTTLIRAICKTFGVTGEVTSPTFSLVNEYRTSTGQTIYHFDFYRIRSIEEAYDIGYEDYFYSGHTCLIEWPEKIGELLGGEPVLNLTLARTSPSSRSITVS
jgi:tRNA threonylcarbamoyladenosine biosynthesis protein TsaE